MSVQVYLEPYRQTFSLPREFILSVLAGSVLADALEGDPTATFIPIPNPVITPTVMQFLVDYAHGKEPVKHIPDLVKASSYLNIPWVLYYVDPLYDYITDKVHWNSPSNQEILKKAIQEDRVWIVGYYLNRGVKPTQEDFIQAVEAHATDVLALLLASVTDLTDIVGERLLVIAINHGFKQGVDMLLSKGVPVNMTMLHNTVETDRADILGPLLRRAEEQGGAAFYINGPINPYDILIQELLDEAASHGQLRSLDYLLTHTDATPSYQDNLALYETLDNEPKNIVEIAKRIISDAKFTPNYGLDGLLSIAAERNQTEILQMLLQDPRTRLTAKILEAAIEAADEAAEDDAIDNAASRQILQETLRGLWYRPVTQN